MTTTTFITTITSINISTCATIITLTTSSLNLQSPPRHPLPPSSCHPPLASSHPSPGHQQPPHLTLKVKKTVISEPPYKCNTVFVTDGHLISIWWWRRSQWELLTILKWSHGSILWQEIQKKCKITLVRNPFWPFLKKSSWKAALSTANFRKTKQKWQRAGGKPLQYQARGWHGLKTVVGLNFRPKTAEK